VAWQGQRGKLSCALAAEGEPAKGAMLEIEGSPPNLPDLVAAMLRPDFYPHHPAEVNLVQTHISYVLLAGGEVYKIKKPVRFSFLDFSTLEKRRWFCREEVRLNRRLAPDIYRGVVAVCRSGLGYRLGPEEDPDAVEFAVHMRRLPDDRMLDRMLERDLVTPEMMDRLAARLAEFHRQAETGPEILRCGEPEQLARVIADDAAEVRPFRDLTVRARDDEAIQRFFGDALASLDSVFRRRLVERRIRDGHGDLHAAHVCFTDGLIIFDCIEFNPAFRYRDVASEVGFLAMDLESHGHRELSAHFIFRYATHSRDADLPRLVPFYQCYLAYIRGKVESLKSAEAEVGEQERVQARAKARHYFELAYRYTWAYSPCLVVVCGLSGTGKSTLAQALQRRTGFAHVNSDVVRKQLAGVPLRSRAVPALYTPDMNARTYRAMLQLAGSYLAGRRGVILDATFQRRDHRAEARAVAREHGVPFVIVESWCAEAEVRQRLARRTESGEGPSDADWDVYLRQRQQYEPVRPEEGVCVRFDSTEATLPLETTGVEDELRAAIQQARGGRFA